ncbi:Pao retrotransposon peptidase [Opisthorchis viverrini]|uniref:Pao retrotransposon peptidase n=1 Tax=Opisthorchis viverrini TaxID=6198 RepID=A0A1S8WWB1_OPIVI|nr:Pao retrotransposon peptidase [Opisthorchis viverrini]
MSRKAMNTQRALSVEWDPQCGSLCFRLRTPERPLTRRGFLGAVWLFFDPPELAAPVCLTAKQLPQELCQADLGWNTPVSEDHSARWHWWLNLIKSIGVAWYSRLLSPGNFVGVCTPELHVLSDLSETGYGVASYAPFVPNDNWVARRLVFGKFRFPPLKTVGVPRLELAATALATRVYKLLIENLPNFSAATLRTASHIVLQCISNRSTRFCTFVAN